jgi:hypothetical protein
MSRKHARDDRQLPKFINVTLSGPAPFLETVAARSIPSTLSQRRDPIVSVNIREHSRPARVSAAHSNFNFNCVPDRDSAPSALAKITINRFNAFVRYARKGRAGC